MTEQHAVRHPVEAYFAALDRRDFDRVAGCFTADCVAEYNGTSNNPAVVLRGGRDVADYTRVLETFTNSVHAVASLDIRGDGEGASADTFAIAHLLQGAAEGGRIRVRGLRYRDRLVMRDGRWCIAYRLHIPLWQYDVPATERSLTQAAIIR